MLWPGRQTVSCSPHAARRRQVSKAVRRAPRQECAIPPPLCWRAQSTDGSLGRMPLRSNLARRQRETEKGTLREHVAVHWIPSCSGSRTLGTQYSVRGNRQTREEGALLVAERCTLSTPTQPGRS